MLKGIRVSYTKKEEQHMVELLNYQSKALEEDVTIKIALPEATNIDKVLILLHGNIQPECEFSLIENLPQELDMQNLCEKYNLMVVIPYMRNHYYISTTGYCVSGFIGEELPELVLEKYHLAANTDLILGGISMGGYGAVLNGAICGIFNNIISISGAFVQDDVRIGNPEVWLERKPTVESTKGSYLEFFLPLEDLDQSIQRNVVPAISLFKSRKQNPFIVMTCGTVDWLFERNRKFEMVLEKHKIRHVFFEMKGDHDSLCFKEGLWKAIAECLDRQELEGKGQDRV